jgi:phage tail-like protein
VSARLPPVTLPARTLPVAGPPHDPTSLLLAGRIGPQPRGGWRAHALTQLEVAPGLALALEAAPGAARRLVEPSGSFGGLRLPLNAALGPAGEVYLLDPLSARLLRFDPCTCRFEPARCALALAEPHGIAICGSELYVADSGHARVLRYSLNGFAPRAALRLPPKEARRRAGAGASWYPFALAFDGNGRLYVSDPRNLCVDVFDPQGRWRGAYPCAPAPWALAVDRRDRLHAVLAPSAPVLASPNDGHGARWRWPEGVEASVAVFENAQPRDVGARVGEAHDFPAPVLPVDSRGHLRLACAEGEVVFDARGTRLPLESRAREELYVRTGAYRSRALDSGIEGCPWHRVELRGALPEGCAVTVRTLSAHVELGEDELAGLPAQAWSVNASATALDRDGRWDCLVRSAPGRFLWLRLEFSGDGFATPALESALVEFPRVSLRRFLPAVFGAEPASADFTDRFTAIFDTTLRSIERRLDRLAERFDPLSAPARDFLPWLASWIGLTLARDWDEKRRRRYVKEAARLYCLRGTPLGLRRQLWLLLGFDAGRCSAERPQTSCAPLPRCWPAPARRAAEPPPLILEHFKLRRWLHAGRGRLGDESVLWGKSIVERAQLSAGARVGSSKLSTLPDPLRDPFHVHAHRFSVFVPARVRESDGERRSLEQLLEREAPAHALWDVRYVEPRFRVGVQATLGLDSVVARTPRDVHLGAGVLGRGTVLSAPPARRGGPKLRVGEARVGSGTALT